MKANRMTKLVWWSRCIIVVLLAVVLAISSVACGNSNQSPSITSLVANPVSVGPGDSSTVTCVAADLDGDALSYTWTFTGGSQSGTGDTITWVAPSAANTYTVKVTVSDGKGGMANGSVVIIVAPTPTPTPTGGSIDIKSSPAGAEVIIDGVDTGSITPYVATNIASGNHSVKLEYTHYKWRQETVSVSGGQTTYINWALTYADDQTLTIQPNASDGKDTWVAELYPDQNSASSVGTYVDGDSAGQRFRTYIHFNLDSIPATAVVTVADLGLYYYVSAPGAVASTVGVYKVTSSWNESVVTWDNQPASSAAPEDTEDMSGAPTNTFLLWSITSLTQSWHDGSIPNYGIMLRDADENTYEGRKAFYSSDWSDSTQCPKLTITYYDPTP
jgi:hypothetical protein